MIDINSLTESDKDRIVIYDDDNAGVPGRYTDVFSLNGIPGYIKSWDSKLGLVFVQIYNSESIIPTKGFHPSRLTFVDSYCFDKTIIEEEDIIKMIDYTKKGTFRWIKSSFFETSSDVSMIEGRPDIPGILWCKGFTGGFHRSFIKFKLDGWAYFAAAGVGKSFASNVYRYETDLDSHVDLLLCTIYDKFPSIIPYKPMLL